MLLYEHPLSSYAQKISIVRREKGSEFEAAIQGMGNAAEHLASGAIRREYRDHRLEWMMESAGANIDLDGIARNNIRFTRPT
jgi:glutathione S-transferase/RNA polymerase-associated protein